MLKAHGCTSDLYRGFEPTPGLLRSHEPTPGLFRVDEPTPVLFRGYEPTQGLFRGYIPTPGLEAINLSDQELRFTLKDAMFQIFSLAFLLQFL